MRTVEEQMIEITKRKKSYQAAKNSRRFAVTGAGLLLVLILVIEAVPGPTEIVEQNALSVLGSTILGAKEGGYILVALLAFALGVCTTMLCRQYHKNKSFHKEDKPRR